MSPDWPRGQGLHYKDQSGKKLIYIPTFLHINCYPRVRIALLMRQRFGRSVCFMVVVPQCSENPQGLPVLSVPQGTVAWISLPSGLSRQVRPSFIPSTPPHRMGHLSVPSSLPAISLHSHQFTVCDPRACRLLCLLLAPTRLSWMPIPHDIKHRSDPGDARQGKFSLPEGGLRRYTCWSTICENS